MRESGAYLREHGGLDASLRGRFGWVEADVLDFSVNVNPYGPSPRLRDAVLRTPLERYPDPSALEARKRLGAHHGFEPDRLVVGHGAADLFFQLASAIVDASTRALFFEPTFSEFAAAVEARGGTIVRHRTTAGEGFAPSRAAIEEAIARLDPTIVYLCNPNNPTGSLVPTETIGAIAGRFPRVRFVIDEAFLALSDRPEEARVPLPESVVRVRSLTKEHAIPGLRIGFLVAPVELARRVERLRASWSTSAFAQTAAIVSVEEGEFVEQSRRKLVDDREHARRRLAGLGLEVLPSAAPYLLVRVGAGTALRDRLLARHRILVRDATSFGLPEYVRIAARPPADTARLVEAMRKESA